MEEHWIDWEKLTKRYSFIAIALFLDLLNRRFHIGFQVEAEDPFGTIFPFLTATVPAFIVWHGVRYLDSKLTTPEKHIVGIIFACISVIVCAGFLTFILTPSEFPFQLCLATCFFEGALVVSWIGLRLGNYHIAFFLVYLSVFFLLAALLYLTTIWGPTLIMWVETPVAFIFFRAYYKAQKGRKYLGGEQNVPFSRGTIRIHLRWDCTALFTAPNHEHISQRISVAHTSAMLRYEGQIEPIALEHYLLSSLEAERKEFDIVGLWLKVLAITYEKQQESIVPPPPPKGLLVGDTIASEHQPSEKLYLEDEVRNRAFYILGITGTGKSTAGANCAIQDIYAGRGVGFIDPHGDSADFILSRIPSNRVKDVIWFHPADPSQNLAIDILHSARPQERPVLAADLFQTFVRLTEEAGSRWGNILQYTIHTLASLPDTTFMDMKHFLLSDALRNMKLAALQDDPDNKLRNFWRNEFPRLPKDACQPITNRMGEFELSPELNKFLSTPRGKLRIEDVMNENKIFIANLSGFGQRPASLLGSLLMSQIQLAAFRRAGASTRADYFWYVDEFQNYLSSAFEEIMTGARKFHVFLTLMHQGLAQVEEPRIREAIINNSGPMLIFNCGTRDAATLSNELGVKGYRYNSRSESIEERYTASDITSLKLDHHEAYFRGNRGWNARKLITSKPFPLSQDYSEHIKKATIDHYSSQAKPPDIDFGQPPDDDVQDTPKKKPK